MPKKLLIALAAVVALVAVAGLVLGNHFRVERRVSIKADVARVHELCGELKNWPKWAPWQESDPSIVVTLGETTTGVGAHQSWKGDGDAGELTFTKCDPATGIQYDMWFINGEKRSPSISMMNYRPLADGVEVSWVIEGEIDLPILGAYLALAFDSMVGPMFEQGLAKLKSACEKG